MLSISQEGKVLFDFQSRDEKEEESSYYYVENIMNWKLLVFV